MHNVQRLISTIILMLATFLMVTTSVMPHHHHEDGSICLTTDIGQDSNTEHNHSHNGCDNDCAMNLDVAQDASQIGHASKDGLLPTLTAIMIWDNNTLAQPIVKTTRSYFIYIEHSYPGIVSHTSGLRAPPTVA